MVWCCREDGKEHGPGCQESLYPKLGTDIASTFTLTDGEMSRL